MLCSYCRMDRREARRFFVGVTDKSWFDFLANEHTLDEVNFWRPGGGALNALQGAPFLFKLPSPYDAIAGVGFFENAEPMSIATAWNFYGPKNGVPSEEALRVAIARKRRKAVTLQDIIGCVVLSQPTFFPPQLWIRQPQDWKPTTVVGKFYDLDEGEGARIWSQVAERLGLSMPPLAVGALDPAFGGRGKPALYLPRLGQGTFRKLVLSAYGNRCAVTGERALPAVEAAHIVEFRERQRHSISNGIALRADIHKLFDDGYVSVRPDYRFVVSTALHTDFENGATYYELAARLGNDPISVPTEPHLRPKAEYLERHYNEKFRR